MSSRARGKGGLTPSEGVRPQFCKARCSLYFTLAFLALVHLTRAFEAPTIPLNWTTLSTCAVDNAARVLAGDITTITEENTPAACITACAASGFGYAGVNFGDECHCAIGLKASLDEGPAAARSGVQYGLCR